MKKELGICIVALAICSVASAQQGQANSAPPLAVSSPQRGGEPGTKPLGLSVRAGLMFPSTKAARDVGSQWFAAGADFKLGDLKFSRQGSQHLRDPRSA